MKFLSLLAAASLAVAAPSPSCGDVPSAATCKEYKIPVKVTSNNLVVGFTPFESNFEVAGFIDSAVSRSAKTDGIFKGAENQTAEYTISATFCEPKSKKAAKETVLIATHGLNYDRGYWNPKLDSKYSFVNYAVNQGYSILYYDRLGVGKSSIVSGYVAQLSNQVAVLNEIIALVKQGKYTGSTGKPGHVVLVGHSFGSAISLGAAGLAPDATDGLILTGFGLNSTFVNGNGFLQAAQPRIANERRNKQWGKLDTGYLTNADLFSNVNTFFFGDYDHKVAAYAEATKAPFAISELLTTGAVDPLPLSYKGAAMIISGKYDFIICQSDCDGILESPANKVFSHAKGFKAISYPNAGHGINLHKNAQGAFKEITDFLGKYDL